MDWRALNVATGGADSSMLVRDRSAGAGAGAASPAVERVGRDGRQVVELSITGAGIKNAR